MCKGKAEEIGRREFEKLLDETGITDEFMNAVEKDGIEGGLQVIISRTEEIQSIIEQVREVYVKEGGELGKPVKMRGITLGEHLKNLKKPE